MALWTTRTREEVSDFWVDSEHSIIIIWTQMEKKTKTKTNICNFANILKMLFNKDDVRQSESVEVW